MGKYIIYKTTNVVNNKYYIGKHKQKTKKFDGYIGSGTLLKQAIEKYGLDSFVRETLYSYDTEDECFEKEKELITGELIDSDQCYNLRIGGLGGWSHLTDEAISKRQDTVLQKYGSKFPRSNDPKIIKKRERSKKLNNLKDPSRDRKRMDEVNKVRSVNFLENNEWASKIVTLIDKEGNSILEGSIYELTDQIVSKRCYGRLKDLADTNRLIKRGKFKGCYVKYKVERSETISKESTLKWVEMGSTLRGSDIVQSHKKLWAVHSRWTGRE